MKWLNNLLQRPPEPEASPFLGMSRSELERELTTITQEHAQLLVKYGSARGAHAALSSRVYRLRTAHPDIWSDFFTKEGDARRGVSTTPKKTEKSRC